jgi:hypothetical protein
MNPYSVPAFVSSLVLLAAASPAAAMIVGSGHPATEERPVSGYHGIGLSAPADVEIVQGDSEGATVTADDNVLPKLETVVEDGILKIRLDDSFTMHTKIRVVVRAKAMDMVAISGSGDVHAKTLDTPRLKVAISGSGDVALPAITTRLLAAHVSGSGGLNAAGRADAFEAHLAGSGDVKAPRLETERAELHIAGSSDVLLWVKKSLKVSVAGSGDVRYYGDPTIQRSVVGSGSVKRLGASPP